MIKDIISISIKILIIPLIFCSIIFMLKSAKDSRDNRQKQIEPSLISQSNDKEKNMPNFRHVIWYGWRVVGHEDWAVAINMADEAEIHYFIRDPDCNNDAFIRACGWCYPGLGTNDKDYKNKIIK